jgi:hypothetical protein
LLRQTQSMLATVHGKTAAEAAAGPQHSSPL